jgi:hypothetical protein
MVFPLLFLCLWFLFVRFAAVKIKIFLYLYFYGEKTQEKRLILGLIATLGCRAREVPPGISTPGGGCYCDDLSVLNSIKAGAMFSGAKCFWQQVNNNQLEPLDAPRKWWSVAHFAAYGDTIYPFRPVMAAA